VVTVEGERGWVDVVPSVLEVGDKWSQLRVRGVGLMFLPQSWTSGTSGHRSAQFYTCDVIYRLADFVFVKTSLRSAQDARNRNLVFHELVDFRRVLVGGQSIFTEITGYKYFSLP